MQLRPYRDAGKKISRPFSYLGQYACVCMQVNATKGSRNDDDDYDGKLYIHI